MDIHRCGDCQKEFTSFEDFLIHKLLTEQYYLTIEQSGRIPGLRLPKFLKKQKENPKIFLKDENSESPEPADSGSTVPSESGNDSGSPANAISSPAPTEAVSPAPVPSLQTLPDPNASEKPTTPDHSLVKTMSPQNQDSDSVDVEDESDDNISVGSHTESLRIDESIITKDNRSSPHSETEHNQTGQPYCRHCKRYYKTKVGLRVHEETVHSTERPFTCPFCQHSFKTNGSLIRHQRLHTGERPYRCQECGRSFVESGTLSRHINRLHPKLSRGQTRQVQVLITRLDQRR